jgi:hypothetical protein
LFSLLDGTDMAVPEMVKHIDGYITLLLSAEEPLPLGWRIREAKRLDESGKPEEAEALLREVHGTMDVRYALPSTIRHNPLLHTADGHLTKRPALPPVGCGRAWYCA